MEEAKEDEVKKKKEIDWGALDDEEEEEPVGSVGGSSIEEISQQMKKRLWAALDEEFAEADWKGFNVGEESDEEDSSHNLPSGTTSSSSSSSSDVLSKYNTVLSKAVNDYVKAREQKEKNVIHQGFLTKLGGKKRTKGWQRRWFVLTDTMLNYFKKPGVSHFTSNFLSCIGLFTKQTTKHTGIT